MTGQEEAERFATAALAWWDDFYHACIRPETYRRVNPQPEDET